MPEFTKQDDETEKRLCDCGGVGFHAHITKCAAITWWEERVKEESERRVHVFESTGDAYDATQCDDELRDRDLLVVESEGVVGVVWTWPFAVTKEKGELLSTPGTSEEQVSELTKFCVEVLSERDRSDLWRDAIKAAKKIAVEKGWEVVP